MAPFAKKTSTTTELVLGSAAGQLKKGLEELTKAATVLSELGTKSEGLTLEISNKEEQIKALDVEYAEKRRAHSVELDLKVKENTLQVVTQTLASQHLVAIPEQELTTLKKELSDYQNGMDAQVKAQVGAATGAMKSHLESEKKLLEANFATKEAENIASLKNLNAQVLDLKEQNEQWKKQLDAERAASVQRAQAGSIGTLNVGSTGNGR